MDIEEDCDSYLVNTNYNYDYPLEGMSLTTASNILSMTLPTTSDSNTHQAHKAYTSLSELESIHKNKSKGEFIAVHINAVSLVAHYDEIESLLNNASPDVLCISETRLNDDKIDFQLKLVSHSEYNLVYNNSALSAGGVAIYIKKCHRFTVKSELKLDMTDCESIFTEVDLSDRVTLGNKNSLIVGCIYRHPRHSIQTFVQQMNFHSE